MINGCLIYSPPLSQTRLDQSPLLKLKWNLAKIECKVLNTAIVIENAMAVRIRSNFSIVCKPAKLLHAALSFFGTRA